MLCLFPKTCSAYFGRYDLMVIFHCYFMLIFHGDFMVIFHGDFMVIFHGDFSWWFFMVIFHGDFMVICLIIANGTKRGDSFEPPGPLLFNAPVAPMFLHSFIWLRLLSRVTRQYINSAVGISRRLFQVPAPFSISKRHKHEVRKERHLEMVQVDRLQVDSILIYFHHCGLFSSSFRCKRLTAGRIWSWQQHSTMQKEKHPHLDSWPRDSDKGNKNLI